MQDKRDEFFDLYFKMNTDNTVNKEISMAKLKELSQEIPELTGWPKDKEKFWDVESYYWSMRFNKIDRDFIIKKVNEHTKEPHLDLACGALPVNHTCTCLDLSKEMLDMIRTNQKKIQFDIDKNIPLPFNSNSFNSISAVFILNYIKNLDFLIKDIYRTLKDDGKLIIVQSLKPLHKLHQQMEEHNPLYFEDTLIEKLERIGFFITIEKLNQNNNEILILVCEK